MKKLKSMKVLKIKNEKILLNELIEFLEDKDRSCKNINGAELYCMLMEFYYLKNLFNISID